MSLASSLGLTIALTTGAAHAQPMPPGHDTATSAPLFVQDLPVGSISVRISRASMTEDVVGASVVGSWTTKDGQPGSATAKTGDDGRAMFSKVPPGSTFSAKAQVEGTALATMEFTVPDQGGTRLLMLVGGGSDQAMAGMAGQSPHGTPRAAQRSVVHGGKIEPRDGLPAGSVEIRVLDANDKPIAGAEVRLARTTATAGSLKVESANTDATGTARFSNLASDDKAGWAAVVERDGIRVGSQPFALESKRGSAGELRIPGKTSDLAVLRVSKDSRMMVELREDAIGFLENLVIENTSDKVFDPGPRGLLVPLPDNCNGAEKLPGGANVEMKAGVGAVHHGALPPTNNPEAAIQVRVGCVLNTGGSSEIEIVQPMPLGLQGGIAMIQAVQGVGLSAPGIRTQPPERDDNGNELRMYDLDGVTAGQPLRLIVFGLPAREQTGKWIAGLLAGLLVLGGIVVARKPRSTKSG
jgi:hypothetical protein